MRLPIALAFMVISSTFARRAFADGLAPFNCGSGGEPYTRTVCEDAGCPELIEWPGCVVDHAIGARCGRQEEGQCTDIEGRWPSCPIAQTDAGPRPTRTDAGTRLLYCVTAQPCHDVVVQEDGGGCTVGSDEEHRGRLMGLPSALFLGGIFLLALDRRRRKRPRSRGARS